MRILKTVDTTKWGVFTNGYLNASGCNEAVARFVTKADAEDYARLRYGKSWRRQVSVSRVEFMTVDAVGALDALSGEEPDGDHTSADEILLSAVAPEVKAAYNRLVARAKWWATA